MDPRRNSGSYARPTSQYYDFDQQPASYAPLTGQKQSFAARAGRPPAADSFDPADSDYLNSKPHTQPFYQDNAAATSDSRPMREPQAALYAPKPRQSQPYPTKVADDPYSVKPSTSARRTHPRIDTQMVGSRPDEFSPTTSGNRAVREPNRGAVPDRSPLQKLEGKLDDISKEEKRARIEEAEHRARQKAAANQSRRVDEQPRRSSGTGVLSSNSNEIRADRRHSSAPAPVLPNARHPGRGKVDEGGRQYAPNATAASDPHDAQVVGASQKFRRASDALRMQNQAQDVDQVGGHVSERAHEPRNKPGRQDSKGYRHRSRDAGFVGAAAAASTSAAHSGFDGTDKRNNDRSERLQHDPADVGRNDSKRGHRNTASQDYSTGHGNANQIPQSQQRLQTDRTGHKQGLKAAIMHQEPDPLPISAVQIPHARGPSYQVPPQTAASQHAKNQVGFANSQPGPGPGESTADRHHRGLGGLFHRHHGEERVYRKPQELDEWRRAGIAKLSLDDLMFEGTANRHDESRRDARPYEEEATVYNPRLFLKCGPLLRYTGMRREQASRPSHSSTTGREIWRGSVMIVTLDSNSSYATAPTLRIFAQPMDLLPARAANMQGTADELASAYVDPLAGQIKPSRTGRPLFVKPADHLEDAVDLSRVEDNSGLFEATRSPHLAPQETRGPDGQQQHRHITTKIGSRIRRHDGEKAGRYREVKAARLHTERGVTFWRFNIEIELGSSQIRVAYRINRGPAIGFWVPAKGQVMNTMFHSCNGFSLSVDSDTFSGPDPLWRDVLNKHQLRPFHVMLGGGDQIYNDAAMRDTELFREWLQTKNPEHKHKAEFTEDMQDELEDFYLERYSMWFSQGLFGMANSQIPMVNIWDDHDIIDGYGSYPHHFMSTKVFTGLGAVAFKYYMLFQHQSVVSETQQEEPSWLLGASPGPYINELSRSIFMFLGRKVAFLGLDCRTERMRDEILSQSSYDLIFDRCRREIIKGDTKHLIVLLGVPIAYPRLNFLENILTSRLMDPIKAIGRTGVLGGFVNKFDGGVEILDDLDDHWTAKHHKAERNWFIQELQELAAEKSVRVTILGGDVHLGAVGQFYTKKKLGVQKDRDHRYMPNVISSAIVNTPPPVMMGDILNKRNKIHHLDAETDEDMIPMFDRDVDGKPRNNHHLLTRRNYCTIREYIPGSTPPASPHLEHQPSTSNVSQSQDYDRDDRRYPPGSMKRTLSLNRSSFRPGNLVRRLSGSQSRGPQEFSAPGQNQPHDSYDQTRRRDSLETGQRRSESSFRPSSRDQDSYFPRGATASGTGRPTFLRRPSNMSEKAAIKAAAKGGAEGNLDGREPGHIDLEGGLDISLNMEVSQRDPAGITEPYRLLVPALWYEGEADINTARFKGRRASLMDRLRGRTRNSAGEEDYSGSEMGSRTPSQRTDAGSHAPATHSSNQNVQYRQSANDGAHDPRHSQQRPYNGGAQDSRTYNKEFGPPPVGNHPATGGSRVNKEFQPSGPAPPGPHPSYQTAAGSASREQRPRRGFFGFRRQTTDDGYGRERYGEESDVDDGSLTGSEIDNVEHLQPRQRRPSKAERFFGIGDEEGWGSDGRQQQESGAPHEVDPNEVPYDGGKRKGWKIWNR
ncbi:hypothetical protein MBLNU459_g4697t2 [Dothideomycetes sp. NU459]